MSINPPEQTSIAGLIDTIDRQSSFTTRAFGALHLTGDESPELIGGIAEALVSIQRCLSRDSMTSKADLLKKAGKLPDHWATVATGLRRENLVDVEPDTLARISEELGFIRDQLSLLSIDVPRPESPAEILYRKSLGQADVPGHKSLLQILYRNSTQGK